MRTTGCRAVLVDSAISHLHTDILRADKKTGVTPTVIGRAPPPCDATRDGLTRAAEFLARSSAIPAQALKKEAEGGAFFLHTSGSTGEFLVRPPPAHSCGSAPRIGIIHLPNSAFHL